MPQLLEWMHVQEKVPTSSTPSQPTRNRNHNLMSRERSRLGVNEAWSQECLVDPSVSMNLKATCIKHRPIQQVLLPSHWCHLALTCQSNPEKPKEPSSVYAGHVVPLTNSTPNLCSIRLSTQANRCFPSSRGARRPISNAAENPACES